MKRRNADAGKLRRPMKRTKITEGMYGNSMLYLKFVMVWATVVLADYMLDFRFEFLWPFWMMLRSVYDSYRYQGFAFSLFFICVAFTSDLICLFFIPVQYIIFAASTYVWVQYVWYTYKGVCLPTVAVCCLAAYVEGAWRGVGVGVGGAGGARGGALCRPLAAHCVGYPAVTLGAAVKRYVGHRLRVRRQRKVRAENEFYFQLMRDALPESALEQNQQPTPQAAKETERSPTANGSADCSQTPDTRQMNGSAVRRKCVKPEQNGHCPLEHSQLHAKLEKLEQHIAQKTAGRERDKSTSSHTQTHAHTNAHTHAHSHALSNGTASGAGCSPPDEEDHKHEHSKGSAKSSKYEKKEANTLKEERRKHKNKDKDVNDSHKSTEHIKEHISKDKEVESTKESVKIKESNNSYKEKDRERESNRETREREKERERERERELREARECAEELKRVKAELAAARGGEAEARRALAAAAAAERTRRNDHMQLKQAHATLQHKVCGGGWRSGERASLERRLCEERRARAAAEQLLRTAHQARTPSAECESEWCKSRVSSAEGEAASLRREVQRARDRVTQLQRDLTLATDQVRTLEARQEESAAAVGAVGGVGAVGAVGAGGWQALQERAAHLQRALSAETRVKLDLLSALGDAKRKMHIQEGLITRQEKELEELKAQMLAVMPTEFVSPVGARAVGAVGVVGASVVSKLRLSDGSPLDPNASVYTPKQLCSDA